jgi:hypothetical protein
MKKEDYLRLGFWNAKFPNDSNETIFNKFLTIKVS